MAEKIDTTAEPDEVVVMTPDEGEELTAEEMAEFKQFLTTLGGPPTPPPHIQLMQRTSFAAEMQFDPESRTIFLLEEITEEVMKRFLPQFYILDSTPGDISIVMSSVGGSLLDGMVIYAAIKAARNNVTIYGTGCIYSMAAIIMQAGTTRLLDENCRFMIHSGSGGAVGEAKVVKANVAEHQQLIRMMHDIVQKASGLSKEKVKELFFNESFMSAREAVKLNLADRVVRGRRVLPPPKAKEEPAKRGKGKKK